MLWSSVQNQYKNEEQAGRSLTEKIKIKKKLFWYMVFSKRPPVAHMFNHGWWQLAVGGWWRLVVGGSWQGFWSKEIRTFNRKFTLMQHPMSLGPFHYGI